MGTRSTTHFIDSRFGNTPEAIIYRHWDGYPDGAGKDIFKFLSRCKRLSDTRLGDTSFLAARYVVFLGEMYATDSLWKDSKGKLHDSSYNHKNPEEQRQHVKVPRKERIDFLSVGVMKDDPLDIEYRYVIDCGKRNPKTGLPEVKCYRVSRRDDGTDLYAIETAIPRHTKVGPTPDVIFTKEVSSESGNGTYTVEYNATTRTRSCTCPSFKFSKGNGCKHLYAVQF